jgi:hypothetical protein
MVNLLAGDFKFDFKKKYGIQPTSLHDMIFLHSSVVYEFAHVNTLIIGTRDRTALESH